MGALQVPAHVHSVINRDGAILLDVRRNEMLSLNVTASYVWQRLQQGQPIEEIIEALSSETETDVMTLRRDVADFLEELKAKHLIISTDT
jgi:hypothetical protein